MPSPFSRRKSAFGANAGIGPSPRSIPPSPTPPSRILPSLVRPICPPPTPSAGLFLPTPIPGASTHTGAPSPSLDYLSTRYARAGASTSSGSDANGQTQTHTTDGTPTPISALLSPGVLPLALPPFHQPAYSRGARDANNVSIRRVSPSLRRASPGLSPGVADATVNSERESPRIRASPQRSPTRGLPRFAPRPLSSQVGASSNVFGSSAVVAGVRVSAVTARNTARYSLVDRPAAHTSPHSALHGHAARSPAGGRMGLTMPQPLGGEVGGGVGDQDGDGQGLGVGIGRVSGTRKVVPSDSARRGALAAVGIAPMSMTPFLVGSEAQLKRSPLPGRGAATGMNPVGAVSHTHSQKLLTGTIPRSPAMRSVLRPAVTPSSARQQDGLGSGAPPSPSPSPLQDVSGRQGRTIGAPPQHSGGLAVRALPQTPTSRAPPLRSTFATGSSATTIRHPNAHVTCSVPGTRGRAGAGTAFVSPSHDSSFRPGAIAGMQHASPGALPRLRGARPLLTPVSRTRRAAPQADEGCSKSRNPDVGLEAFRASRTARDPSCASGELDLAQPQVSGIGASGYGQTCPASLATSSLTGVDVDQMRALHDLQTYMAEADAGYCPPLPEPATVTIPPTGVDVHYAPHHPMPANNAPVTPPRPATHRHLAPPATAPAPSSGYRNSYSGGPDASLGLRPGEVLTSSSTFYCRKMIARHAQRTRERDGGTGTGDSDTGYTPTPARPRSLHIADEIVGASPLAGQSAALLSYAYAYSSGGPRPRPISSALEYSSTASTDPTSALLGDVFAAPPAQVGGTTLSRRAAISRHSAASTFSGGASGPGATHRARPYSQELNRSHRLSLVENTSPRPEYQPNTDGPAQFIPFAQLTDSPPTQSDAGALTRPGSQHGAATVCSRFASSLGPNDPSQCSGTYEEMTLQWERDASGDANACDPARAAWARMDESLGRRVNSALDTERGRWVVRLSPRVAVQLSTLPAARLRSPGEFTLSDYMYDNTPMPDLVTPRPLPMVLPAPPPRPELHVQTRPDTAVCTPGTISPSGAPISRHATRYSRQRHAPPSRVGTLRRTPAAMRGLSRASTLDSAVYAPSAVSPDVEAGLAEQLDLAAYHLDDALFPEAAGLERGASVSARKSLTRQRDDGSGATPLRILRERTRRGRRTEGEGLARLDTHIATARRSFRPPPEDGSTSASATSSAESSVASPVDSDAGIGAMHITPVLRGDAKAGVDASSATVSSRWDKWRLGRSRGVGIGYIKGAEASDGRDLVNMNGGREVVNLDTPVVPERSESTCTDIPTYTFSRYHAPPPGEQHFAAPPARAPTSTTTGPSTPAARPLPMPIPLGSPYPRFGLGLGVPIQLKSTYSLQGQQLRLGLEGEGEGTVIKTDGEVEVPALPRPWDGLPRLDQYGGVQGGGDENDEEEVLVVRDLDTGVEQKIAMGRVDQALAAVARA